MQEEEQDQRFFEFEHTTELKIQFTDGRIREYVADAYSIGPLMVHLYVRVGDVAAGKLVRMIPYMMIREIEIIDTDVKGLLKTSLEEK